MITKLTPEQEKRIPEFVEKWLRYAQGECDKQESISALSKLYEMAGEDTPLFIFCESPIQAFMFHVLLRLGLKGEAKMAHGVKCVMSVEDQLGDQFGDHLWGQLRVQLWDQLGDQLEVQLQDQLRGQLGDQLGYQLGNQFQDHLWDQLRGQLGNQPQAQLGDQLGAQLWDQFGSQLRVQLRDQLRDQLGDQLRGQLWDQFGSQLWGQLGNQLGGQLGDQLGVQLGDQFLVQLRDQFLDQLRDQLWGQLQVQLGNQLGNQLRDQLWGQLRDQIRDQLGVHTRENYNPEKFLQNILWVVGWHTAWAGWLDYGHYIGVVFNTEKLHTYTSICRNISMIIPYKKFCFVVKPPVQLHWSANRRLHNPAGPAVLFSDNYALYALNGVRVPPSLVTTPAAELDPTIILTEKNAEVRREIVRKIGIERLCEKLNTKVLNTWYDYQLLELQIPEMTTPARYLKMVNPSTGTYHIEGVPPHIKTCEEALTWRVGGLKWAPKQLT